MPQTKNITVEVVPQVYFAILAERTVMQNPFRHFTKLCVRAGQLGYHIISLPTKMRTDLARDTIVQEFRKLSQNPEDVLVTLDCDHNDEEDLIERLVANNVPVVAALAVRSNPSNPLPCFWVKDANGMDVIPQSWEQGLVKASVVGFGAVAIKRWVFDKLAEMGWDGMYFFYQYHPDGTRVSDEIAFSTMCQQANIPIFVDTRIEIPHWVEGELDVSSYVQWRQDHPAPVRREHKVSVIIPQLGRMEKFKKALGTLAYTAPDVEIICVIDVGDEESKSVLHDDKTLFCIVPDGMRPIDKWNYGLRAATGDVIVAAANDVEFREHWLENALALLDSTSDGDAMIAFNDLVTDGNVSSPHFLMTREYIKKYNGGVLMPPCYKFNYPDVENRVRAQAMKRYAWASNSIVKHLHPMTGTAPKDELHESGTYASFDEDKKLFLDRLANDFPITWKPVIE